MHKKIQERFRNQLPLLLACFVCMIFFFNHGTIFADSFNVNISGPTTVAVGTPVQYSAPAIDNASYVWIFGNGTGSITGQTVSHTFTSSGDWNVSVDVSVNASPPSEGSGSINVTVIQAYIDSVTTTYIDTLGSTADTECTINVKAEGDPSGGNNITIAAVAYPDAGSTVTPSSAQSSSSVFNPYTAILPLPDAPAFVGSPTMIGVNFMIYASYTYGEVTSYANPWYYTTP